MDLSNRTFADTSEEEVFRPKFSDDEPVISGKKSTKSPSSPERGKVTSWKDIKEAATPSPLSKYKGRLHATSEGNKSGGASTFTALYSPSLIPK
jgi:hypothetical protein